MTETYLQAAMVFAVWTYLVYRIGAAAGRASAGRDALSGPPAAMTPRKARVIPDEIRPAIEDALRRKKKIEAIRILREATGMGLKDSKETIEAEWP